MRSLTVVAPPSSPPSPLRDPRDSPVPAARRGALPARVHACTRACEYGVEACVAALQKRLRGAPSSLS
eukprot:2737122-Pyramimonas_sp.AAC.1